MIKNEKIPNFLNSREENIPMELKWDTGDIFHSIKEWEKTLTDIHHKISMIKSLSLTWCDSAKEMFGFLSLISIIEKEILKLYSYAALNSDTKMDESKYISMKGDIQKITVELNESLSFMEKDIIRSGEKKIKSYMDKEPDLKDYSMLFKSVLRRKKHILSGKAAKISALTALFSDTSQKTSSILNNLEIPSPEIVLSNKDRIILNWTSYEKFRGSANRSDRKKVMKKFWKNHSGFRNTHAALLDGEMKKNYFNSKSKNYSSSLEASLFPNGIDTKVYHLLIKSVKENLAPLHRYLDLKKRLLGLKKLKYEDLYASSIIDVNEKIYSYKEGTGLIKKAMEPLGDEYIELLSNGFSGNWVDIYPNKYKISGAYSNGMIKEIHPFVLMNYNGKFSSVSTLAHEMGHALHSWYSNNNQPFPKAEYPIFLAEIASTFNENLLVRYMIKNETDELMRMFILDKYIEGFRTTLYRQTMFAEFELEMNSHIEKGGTLTADWLDEKYIELTREYYGHKTGILDVDEYIANEWSAIPHFYYNFYVYQYSTGIIASGILAEHVFNGGREEKEKYINFLKSGNSDYPLNILKKTGVDLTDPDSFKIVFQNFDRLVNELEMISIPTSPNFLLS